MMQLKLSVLLLGLLALFLVSPSLSNAQTTEIVTGQETTANQLPTMDQFTPSGGTRTTSGNGCATGAFCTAGKQGPGGKFSSTFDLQDGMTIDQINRGFAMNYGMDVTSHVSNSTLSSCVDGNVMQNSDCRDIFNLTVSLFDTGNVLAHKFEHEVELDFSGTRNFAFSQTIQENSFTSLTGEFVMFGIDAGFKNKFFGPRFANPSLTNTFDLVTIIETEILDVLNTTSILDTNVAEPVEITNIEVEVESSSGQQMQLEMEVQTEMTMEMPTEMAPMTDTAVSEPEIEVAEVSTEIEMEMQDVGEPETATDQPTESTESETEGGTDTGNEQESEPESSNEPEPSEQEGEPEAEPTEAAAEPEAESSNEPEAEEKPKPKVKVVKKKSAKQKAANKIVKKMGDKGKYDSSNQLKTLIVMNVLGNSKKFLVQPTIPQPTGFFTESKMPDAQLPENNAAAWILMGGSNQLHDRLTGLQYK